MGDRNAPKHAIGAAAFFAVLVYPEQNERSFVKRDQLVDAIIYIGARQQGAKPADMAGFKGFDCKDFSQVELRRFETRLDTANRILVDKVFKSVFWLQSHSLTGTKMYRLWDEWKSSGDDIRERARKEVFNPFKPILHLAFAFGTVGISALDNNDIPLDIMSACKGYRHWLSDVIQDSYSKLALFVSNPQIANRRLFDHRLRIVSGKTINLKISGVEFTPTRIRVD
ncbi:MAG: hypothetical protein V7735_23265 [Photobacterium frigidiphilum]|uniref:hypothetical protein n=1 Tax=Photobacterium frigidiphilum TaxID=264736 RepID=UPI00300304D7